MRTLLMAPAEGSGRPFSPANISTNSTPLVSRKKKTIGFAIKRHVHRVTTGVATGSGINQILGERDHDEVIGAGRWATRSASAAGEKATPAGFERPTSAVSNFRTSLW